MDSTIEAVCDGCGYAIHSAVVVWVNGRCYHQGCTPRHWACGCPLGDPRCAYQRPAKSDPCREADKRAAEAWLGGEPR